MQSSISSNVKIDLKLNLPLLEKTEKTKNIFEGIKKVINNNLNVLISGEAGTGKNQIVYTIYRLMQKSNHILEFDSLDYNSTYFKDLLFNKLNFKDFLLEKKYEYKEEPNIIYFKNIDLLDLELQAIFANYLNTKKGKNSFLKNKKFIASTTRNIKQSLRNNNFSNELFYLLDMYNIYSIPLRERLSDIKILVEEIILDYNNNNNLNKTLDVNAYNILTNYIWPGNITQLKNFILRCLKISEEKFLSRKLLVEELNNEFQYAENNFLDNWKINFSELVSKNIRGYLSYNKKINSGVYYKLLKEFERPLIIEVLNYTNNNQLLSAELLGINRNTLRKKMADYEIKIVRKATKN